MFYLGIFIMFCVVVSSIFIVNIGNPVHSVFFLILTFLGGSIFFFLLRNEFIAIIFIIVYIGAIAVLFLFVIMLLDVKIIELKSNTISYVPLSSLFLMLFFFEFLFISKYYDTFMFLVDFSHIFYIDWLNFYKFNVSNIHFIGLFLYTYYFLIFFFCAFLLFIATIGSILLTFLSLKNTLYTYNVRYEYISYYYYIDYTKLIKLVN